jgi:AcrR family transcriptional regulator
MVTRPSKKLALLQAAARVVERQGSAQLTLEAVASEAGLSKGGLLYHFPTKQALIEAMVEHLVEEFSQDVEARRRGGAFLPAYIRATFDYHPQLSVASVLAAALSHDPPLLEPLQKGFEAWRQAALADPGPPPRADLIRLAVDGLWFTELFCLAPMTRKDRRQLEQELLALCQERTDPQ